MQHLSKETIREIVVSHERGESRASIAVRLHIDRSTVSYHTQKYQNDVYALIALKQTHECLHPSLKCLVCGKAHDIIKREDRNTIALLRTRLGKANAKLSAYGLAIE